MNETQFNVQSILASVLADLSERSQDVIVSRFGIGKDRYETLEAIGKRYGITRERVRQIEADALKNVKQSKAKSVLQPLFTALEEFIRSKGGVVDEDNLTVQFALQRFSGVSNPAKYKGMVSFLLSLGKQFNKAPCTDTFAARWFLTSEALKTQEKVCAHLVSQFKQKRKVIESDEIVSLTKSAVAGIGKDVVLTYLAGSFAINQNVFGQWGLSHWPEIKPRGVKDKAYLVVKKEGKPLHFRDVAEFINQNEFSSRTALAQTVHNELIKDARFILVGRGLYALKEWGYKEGTVRDVIARVLKEKGPLVKDELIQAVLAERFVKPSTVILNLNSFNKTSDNKYTLV